MAQHLVRRAACERPAPCAALLTFLALACAPESAGDQRPPQLTSVQQNRSVDPRGATLDLVFDERLRAASAEDLAHYTASNGATPRWAVLLASETTVRVTFDAPLVPGETTLAVDGVLDAAGNHSAPVAFFPLGSDDSVPPTLVSASATSISGAANDRIEIAFDDDLLVADALDPAHLNFEHPLGSALALDGVTLAYDAATRTLALSFSADGAQAVNLQTGSAWRLTIDGLRDVGGNAIALGTAALGTVGGDNASPSLVAATQNLAADATGRIVDLAFSETLDFGPFAYPVSCVGSAGQTALDATLLWPGDVLRVTFDAALVPGVDSLALENLFDLAGNALIAIPVQPVSSADAIPPTLASVSANAASGFSNDTVVVQFSEPVLPADATDLARYELFSGAVVPLVDASIAYDAPTRTTTITLAEIDLVTGSVFALTCSGIRDVSGNPLPPGTGVVTLVSGDATPPSALAAQQNTVIDPFGTTLDVAFDEPVALDAAPPPQFLLDGGTLPVSVQTLAGGAAARLVFATPTLPGIAVLDVVGLRDPAGNAAGTITLAVVGADLTAPSLVGATASAIAGIASDRLTATFDEQVLPSDAVLAAHWSLESPIGDAVSISAATFAYNALTRTVTIDLPAGANLATGASYALSASAIHDVGGNVLPPGSSSTGTVAGDSTAPTIVVADRNQAADPGNRIVDVTFSEEVSAATAQVAANFNVSGTPNTQSATLLLDGRTVRLYTTAAVTAGTTTIAISGVRDLASNLMTAVPTVAITP